MQSGFHPLFAMRRARDRTGNGLAKVADRLMPDLTTDRMMRESIDPLRLTGEPVLVAGFPMLEGEQPKDKPILRRGIVASAELEWREGPMLLLDLTGVPGFTICMTTSAMRNSA